MKKWLKRYGKWMIIGLGVLFIANSIYGAFTTTKDWMIAVYIIGAALWLCLILVLSGVVNKICYWWEKD